MRRLIYFCTLCACNKSPDAEGGRSRPECAGRYGGAGDSGGDGCGRGGDGGVAEIWPSPAFC